MEVQESRDWNSVNSLLHQVFNDYLVNVSLHYSQQSIPINVLGSTVPAFVSAGWATPNTRMTLLFRFPSTHRLSKVNINDGSLLLKLSEIETSHCRMISRQSQQVYSDYHLVAEFLITCDMQQYVDELHCKLWESYNAEMNRLIDGVLDDSDKK